MSVPVTGEEWSLIYPRQVGAIFVVNYLFVLVSTGDFNWGEKITSLIYGK